MRRIILTASTALLLSVCLSCNDKDEDVVQPTLVKEWNIPISTLNENPAPAGRTESGSAQLQLYSDNTFTYHIMLNGLAVGDAITAGHLHFGDPITNGPVILNLAPVFASGMANGEVDVPRQTLVDSILNQTVYINLHSTAFPAGLVRGQLDQTLDFVMDVPLSGANEVPAVTTTATGLAMLRVTADKKLYYRINVNNLEAGDALTAAHIHTGATGVNGGVLVALAGGPADLNITKSITLTDAAFTAVKTGQVYVNVHSTNRPGGIIRGQIR